MSDHLLNRNRDSERVRAYIVETQRFEPEHWQELLRDRAGSTARSLPYVPNVSPGQLEELLLSSQWRRDELTEAAASYQHQLFQAPISGLKSTVLLSELPDDTIVRGTVFDDMVYVLVECDPVPSEFVTICASPRHNRLTIASLSIGPISLPRIPCAKIRFDETTTVADARARGIIIGHPAQVFEALV